MQHWNARAEQVQWVYHEGSGTWQPRDMNGKAINYSHSFDGTVEDCQTKGWFAKMACAPQGSSPAADRGSRIHALLEFRAKHGQWPDKATFEVPMRDRGPQKTDALDWRCARVAEHLVPAGVPGRDFHIEEFINLKAVFEREQPGPGWPGDPEDSRNESLDFKGFIDISDYTGTLAAVAPWGKPEWAGLPTIADWKTRGSKFYAPDEETLPYEPQLGKYAAVGLIGSKFSPWRGRPDAPDFPDKVVVVHLNIGTKTVEAYPRAAVMPMKNVEDIWRKTQEGALRILDLCHIDRLEDTEPNRASCGKYGGCDFKRICPHSPQNRAPKGLFGTGTKRATQKKDKNSMSFADRLKAKKAAKAQTSTPAPKPAEPKAPVSKTLAEKLRERKATTRVQVADTGPQGSHNKKTGEFTPIVTDPLIKDTIRIAQVAAKENSASMSVELVEYAAQEVGLDMTAEGVMGKLREALPDLNWTSVGDTTVAPIGTLIPAAGLVPSSGWWSRLDVVKALPGARETIVDAINDVAQGAIGSDPQVAGALAAIYTAVLRGGGSADRKAVCVKAREEYNGMPGAFPVYVQGEGAKIGRYTKVKLGEHLRLIDFEEAPLYFDPKEDRVIDPSFRKAADEASERENNPNGTPNEDALGAPEPPATPFVEAARDPNLSVERIKAASDEELDEALMSPTTPRSMKGDIMAEQDERKFVELPEAPAGAAVQWQRMVLLNAVPVVSGGVLPGAQDFADWLRPYTDEVSKANGGLYWNSMDFGKGKGLVANAVARDVSRRGIEVLPFMLSVDRQHPAWQAVRDVIGALDGVLFIQATK